MENGIGKKMILLSPFSAAQERRLQVSMLMQFPDSVTLTQSLSHPSPTVDGRSLLELPQ
jgi:hypothetical protein